MNLKSKGAVDILSSWEKRSSHVPIFYEDSASTCGKIKEKSIQNEGNKPDIEYNHVRNFQKILP